jgi:hypothetical protein
MSTVLTNINESIEKIKNHPSFRSWYATQKFAEADLVVINNSFVFRDVITTKAKSYLIMKHGKDRIQRDVYVAQGLKLNTDFTFYSVKHKDPPALTSIGDCVEEELSNIGQFIFALIGNISDDVIITEPFTRSGFSEVIWDPQSTKTLSVDGPKIIIRSPYEESILWDSLTQEATKKNITLDGEETKRAFGALLDKLQGKAEARLVLPEQGKRSKGGVTDIIIETLKERRQDYVQALSICDGKVENNKDAFNEVLRIAYNFSNDVIPFLKLIISIGDLKPIVLWSTIGEHYCLSESLKCLPWTRSKNKASLQNYIGTIGDARNGVFHNLFPVTKALRFQVPDGAFQNSELLFFSEYAPGKTANALNYRDKELVELFMQFTRARQRPVPPEFWAKNVDVIDKVIDLFESTNRVLKSIHGVYFQGKI